MESTGCPIGVFDSGVGGTSIWREVKNLLPNEDIIYLADSKNAPYGPKGKEEIIKLSKKNTDFLISKGCKLVIVACNTATTNAIKVLRNHYSIPFIGIEPAIKSASLLTKTNKIGILATKGTLSSELFEETSHTIDKSIKIIEQNGKGIVELIENGKLNSKEMFGLLSTYLSPMLQEGIDALVLGCTHYPYLIPQLRKIVGENILIVDSGEAVARQTKSVLEKYKLNNSEQRLGTHTFYTNTKKDILIDLLNCKECNVSEFDF